MATVLLIAAVVIAVGVEAAIRWRRRRLETPQDHLRAGDSALKRGDLERAEQRYLDSIRLDYENPEARYRLSLVAWERGDYGGVIEHLRECQRWVPETADLEHGLGAAHYHLGDHEAAIRHYRRALELEPENEEVRGNLAALYHELGRVDEGRDVWPEYEPPAAEERERHEGVWAQLGDGGRRGIGYWRLVARVLYLSAACFAFAFLISFAVILGSLVYGFFTTPGELAVFAKYGDLLAGVIKGSVAGVLLSRAGILVVNALGVSFLRRRMRRAGVSEEDASALLPESTAPPWWKVELSWGHLVLWLGLPVLVHMWMNGSTLPDWTMGAFVYLVVLWFMKGLFMVHLVTGNDEDLERWHAQYRFFGTLKGAAVGLVGLPAVLAVLAYGIWLLMDVVGL